MGSVSTKSRANPFRVGTEIRDPVNFVGRKEILRTVSGAMSDLQNISLHGERRTGKTSLLLYLAHPASAPVTGLPSNHIPVYFNFQGIARTSAGIVWQAIADAVADQIKQRIRDRQAESERFLATIARFSKPPELSVTGLADALAYLGTRDFKVHLLFDEFEQTGENPNLGDPFYDALRSLPTRATNTSYVIATRTGLAALQPVYDKASSPLFNIFTTLTLHPFREEEVTQLILDYSARSGLDFSLAEDLRAQSPFLYQMTGYHPFFLQTLCYHLYEQLDKPDWPLGQARQEALRGFERDSEPHFEYYWDVSSEEERALIEKFATGQSIDWDIRGNAAKSLEDRCLMVPAKSGWQLFSSAFSSRVQEFAALYSAGAERLHEQSWEEAGKRARRLEDPMCQYE